LALITKKIKVLSVRLYSKEVGILEEYQGKMRFQYRKDAHKPLSISLPIREEVYTEKQCKAYFGGLLPENPATRKALGVRYKINENNDFALLAAIGHDCAGAVSFHTVDEPEREQTFIPLQGELISDEELEKQIKDLPVRPYLGRRLSLAGVQEKTPICVINGKMALPVEGSPTTHILKPLLSRFKQSVANEYICLKAAMATGISVPPVEIRQAGSIEFFLIKRFDRIEQNNEIMRLHHEDFAQALGVRADNKYEVTFKDCLKVLSLTNRPALEKMKFISMAVFNYLIGNCDAHGKNFSLLHMDNGILLAPFYDVLCTNVYDLEHTMAMKIGKTRYIEEVTLRDWESFSRQLDVNPALTLEELKRQLNTLPEELEKVVKELQASIGDEILEFVLKNRENTRKRLKL
jgi:serine/threonine-protein kinase HipA